MDDYKEIFKRQLEQLNYLYTKANTKSKKAKLAYDLIFFEDMYNHFADEPVVFPWSDDDDIFNERMSVMDSFVENILKEQGILARIAKENFNAFVLENFSLYTDYGKNYHKMNEEAIQKRIFKFFSGMDMSLVKRFKDKLLGDELFVNNNIGEYAGLTYSMESIGKNIILFDSGENMTIDQARVLVHELGHDFEFDNSRRCGVDNVWNKIVRTSYMEVSSSFFEYAFINYLIDNKIYLDDAFMLKRKFLNQVYYYLSYILIIINVKDLKIDYDYCITLGNVEYANKILEIMNSSFDLYQVGDKINLRQSFIYGIGKLLAIYVYEIYKENPKEFLSKFRKCLIEYKNIGINAFIDLGIDVEDLITGNILKKVLKECK